jgi:DNA-binding transcriptional LysR family regulator
MATSDMLSAFLKVADTSSVSRAAEDLGVGKSVVSKRVAQLEAEVGATLFSRSTRKVVLTPAGEAYAEFASRALAELSAGEERVRALRSELTGRIRLTSSVSWGQHVLSKKMPEFVRLHPGIQVELRFDDRMIDLAAERIDLAFRWSATPPTDLVCIPLHVIGWSLSAAPSYLSAAGVPHQPEDLAGHACLAYWRDNSDDLWALMSTERRAQVRVSGRYRVDNPEAILDAAIAGLGIAMLPDYLCDAALADGRLSRVLPGWIPQTRYGALITAVGTPERLRMSRNQVLLDFLRQSLA